MSSIIYHVPRTQRCNGCELCQLSIDGHSKGYLASFEPGQVPANLSQASCQAIRSQHSESTIVFQACDSEECVVDIDIKPVKKLKNT